MSFFFSLWIINRFLQDILFFMLVKEFIFLIFNWFWFIIDIEGMIVVYDGAMILIIDIMINVYIYDY